MNTLFNKDNKGGVELKELLGFLDIDLKYKNIKQEINASTRELIKLLSKPIYDQLYDDYSKGLDNELIELVQYPIAIDAYRSYAPNGDISHTNNGRRMRMDDNEKQAFEWLIERDNNALERKYYRALDTLIDYLYEHCEEWKSTDAYTQLVSSLFKTTEEFDDIFPINSRLLLLKLQPGIKRALDSEIRPRVTEDTYTTLKTAPEALDSELLNTIKSICVFYSLAWAMPRLSIQLFPEGMLQGYISDRVVTPGRKAAAKNELAYARENFEEDYKKDLLKLEELVKVQIDPVATSEPSMPLYIAGDKYLST
ncbi:DUF6712 family protein [Myroides odoratimimus]|uniref:Uncharacterized protein n=1 Tax=Myroides odoratimimus CIP 101113 TaxID=883154 RepID=A0AAV3F4Z9_9FLAO|nr:DUF6712 family protein [Myroides odoratimimus]EHO13813.1 hypothetical protein HMPREF9715_00887 [Myroides odoratimimus CIP 101113]